LSHGYNKRILHVDLTRGSSFIEEPDDSFYHTYLGGPGIGYYYLLKEQDNKIKPFDPRSLLIFASGLLTGTIAPCVPRYTVCAKSPLTGSLGKSEAGGWWGPELKAAGYDAIVVRGKAAQPVYLWIHAGGVEIKPADHIWGMDTGDADRRIRDELGIRGIRIALIGPAGENLVSYACITNELTHFNGRNGMGAVMGSKNLKAIAVKGEKKVEAFQQEKLKEFARWAAKEARSNPLSKALGTNGTAPGIESNNAAGALPTFNWNRTSFEQAGNIGGERLNKEFLKSTGSCFACPVRCKRIVAVDSTYMVDPAYGGPEYETLAALGSNCGISDLPLLCKANELCNRFGIDTISTGMTISFVMDCFEKGIITTADTGGIKLNFGNGEAVLELIKKIARRDGIGSLLADGSLAASKAFGKESEKFLLQVKGQEVPMHDPRVKTGLGLQFAIAPQGADHWFAQHDPFFVPGNPIGEAAGIPLGITKGIEATDLSWQKVRFCLYTSFLNYAYDALGACVFGVAARSFIPLHKLVEMANLVTGWETSLWGLMKSGERINTMARVYNCREGFTSKDDSLPTRFLENLPDGPNKGKLAISAEAFQAAVKLYYEMAGWDSEGRPSPAKLLELQLDWLV